MIIKLTGGLIGCLALGWVMIVLATVIALDLSGVNAAGGGLEKAKAAPPESSEKG
ncbi:hypothetical protein SAMN03159444_01639 [Pseudomonas sp. NFACC02]|uniref:hypothetical protein n=1 Tax=Pseudomonas sp. NFACC02 TaxID=1566250 RepID=UPI0008D7E2A6|nr:hypothetical protein [Pseudomonas sp. NFACC02]SEQ41019.1 hypothetical protein SAMN03159444_01639 [Pseudomonas sp. NFACC02]